MVWLMPMIGFEVPALLLCLIWMKFLGGETWRGAIIYSLLVVAAFYGIFILALGTSIPHLFYGRCAPGCRLCRRPGTLAPHPCP